MIEHLEYLDKQVHTPEDMQELHPNDRILLSLYKTSYSQPDNKWINIIVGMFTFIPAISFVVAIILKLTGSI